GDALAYSGQSGPNQPALRRAQAIGLDGRQGLHVARYLLNAKVEGQERLLHDFIPSASRQAKVLATCMTRITEGTQIADLLAAEATAAKAYWQAWEMTPM